MSNNKKKSKKKLLFIALGAVVVVIIIIANFAKSDKSEISVTSGKVKQGKITSIVTATGKVKAKTEINLSANVSAKIVELPVKEGQMVTKGQLLVQLDPERYQASVDQYRASLAAQRAQVDLSRAQSEEARLAYERAVKLHEGKLISDEVYDAARTNYDVMRSRYEAEKHSIDRAAALLREAQNQLDYTTITSPIDGTITALNAEVGEIVMIGTMNNPGTVIMTVSDLSEIEVEVEVDETDIANVALSQNVKVELDALPDTSFEGVVTEVGNSARISGSGSSDLVTNFMVTVLMTEITESIRPGMSATCDITTAERKNVLKIPIGAVVLRDEKAILEQRKAEAEQSEGALAQETDTTAVSEESAADDEDEEDEAKELQGVFVIQEGEVLFTEVVTGIADQQNIEIISGLSLEDEIVTGSFKILRELKHGDRVKAKPSSDETKK